MCIIIYDPEGKGMPEERLREAHTANPDGWGVTWYAQNNTRWYGKSTGDYRSFNSYRNMFLDNATKSLIHFRTASSGGKEIDACHPLICDGLLFVQNGNYFEYSNQLWTDKRTDVQRFNDELLKNFPRAFLHIPEIRKALEDYNRNNYSKMVFMDDCGNVDIINESAGEWVDGIWYSNGGIEHYVGYGYSGGYYYNADDVRHKGGLMSIEMLANKDGWVRCESCGGWFKMENDKCDACVIWENLKQYAEGA